MNQSVDFSASAKVEIWHIDQLIPYDRNPRKITPAAVQKVARSIAEFGYNAPIIADEEGVILAGHTRREALIQLGAVDVAVIVKHGLTEAQKRAYRIMDNRAGEEAEWDVDLLKLEMLELQGVEGFDLADLGFDSDELNEYLDGTTDTPAAPAKPAKAAKAAPDATGAFDMSPGSVIGFGNEFWPAREKHWAGELQVGKGEQIDDPVLAEWAIRWFCPQNGLVIDPFAGGYVRGLVASKLGRAYHGIPLPEAVDECIEKLDLADNPAPVWYRTSPLDIGSAIPRAIMADLLFVDVPMPFVDGDDLIAWQNGMRLVVESVVARLRPCRFAVVVAGDVRTPDDMCTGVPWRTVELFQAAGLQLYNAAAYVVPPREERLTKFVATRTLDQEHKSVFVFVNGDPIAAARDCGPV